METEIHLKVASHSGFSPRFTFAVLSLAGLLALILCPGFVGLLGLTDYNLWFLDSYAVLASSDAARAGLSPDAPNPYDVFQRSHKYSDWWFVAGQMGLTRQDNFRVGLAWVLMFLAAAFSVLRPRSQREAAWLALLMMSPPIYLAINRANNDLVIFILLAVAALALRGQESWRVALAVVVMALAAGLKFYPVVAAVVFLLLRPARRLLLASVVAALVLGVVLVSVWATLKRGAFSIHPALHLFGGRIWLMNFGLPGSIATVMAVAGLAAGMAGLARSGWLRTPDEPAGDGTEHAAFVIGAAVLVGCFLAGVSFSYRLIFGLLLAPWLWRVAHEAASSPRRRQLARLAGWLLLGAMWADGLICLVVNVLFAPLSAARLEEIEFIWLIVTQPFVWLLLMLLAGWLIETILTAWRALRHRPA